MFTTTLPAVPYRDPWDISLHDRLRTLARGRRRIAYFYEAPNNSTFRYRAYNMAQVLNERADNDTSASYFFLTDFQSFDEIADLADVLVICRSRYSPQVNQLITKFHQRKRSVLFDIDDLVFDARYIHLIINTLGQDCDSQETWDYWFAYVSRMAETLRLCDGAITTNQYLAAKITEYSGLPAKVVPNFINMEQLSLSESLFRRKIDSGFERDGKICLGYFSGSPSHNLDYAIIASALEQVMENNEHIELMVVGYIEPGSNLKRFGERIKRRPFHDYVNLQRLLSCVEFNLMPLQSNTFTNCKSELKYFEAAIAGTVSIASPSYTYAQAIIDKQNGYLCHSHEWADAIKRAVANIETYAQLATTAFDHAHANYAWTSQGPAIREALGLQ
jgi:glycosyltransferase involved in cell wall biosynthesis